MLIKSHHISSLTREKTLPESCCRGFLPRLFQCVCVSVNKYKRHQYGSEVGVCFRAFLFLLFFFFLFSFALSAKNNFIKKGVFVVAENTQLSIVQNTKLTVISNEINIDSEVKGKGVFVLLGKNKQQLKGGVCGEQTVIIANLEIGNADSIEIKSNLLITEKLEIEKGTLVLNHANVIVKKYATLALSKNAEILSTVFGVLINENQSNHYHTIKAFSLSQNPSTQASAKEEGFIGAVIASNYFDVLYVQQQYQNNVNKVLHPPPEESFLFF